MTPYTVPPAASPTAPAKAPRRLATRRARCLVVFTVIAGGTSAGGAAATDLPPGLVADFTRQVQPLLLNKCAAGACHGGASAHAPRFQRAGVGGQFDRTLTLSNIATLDEAIRSAGSAGAFLTTISARHPVSGSSRHKLLPLTTAERAVLERWIAAAAGRRPAPFTPINATPLATATASPVTVAAASGPTTPPAANAIPAAAAGSTGDDDTAVTQPPAAGGKPAGTVAARPNRFRAMLDAAANPPPLPPPQEPKGILLRDSAE